MQRNDPGGPGIISQDRLESTKLRRANETDRVGKREVRTGIGVEQNDSATMAAVCGFDQREDRIPDSFHLPPSAYGAAFRQGTQPLHAVILPQVIAQGWPQPA